MGWGTFAAGQAIGHARRKSNRRRARDNEARRERQRRAAARDRRVSARKAEAQREAVREARIKKVAEAQQALKAEQYHAEREAAWEDTEAKRKAYRERQQEKAAADERFMRRFTPEQREQIMEARGKQDPETTKAAQEPLAKLPTPASLSLGEVLIVMVVTLPLSYIASAFVGAIAFGITNGSLSAALITTSIVFAIFIAKHISVIAKKKKTLSTSADESEEEEPLPVIIGSEPKQDK